VPSALSLVVAHTGATGTSTRAAMTSPPTARRLPYRSLDSTVKLVTAPAAAAVAPAPVTDVAAA